MRPERQFWLWVLALTVGMYAMVGAQMALFYATERGTLALLPVYLRANLLVFLTVALASLLPFLVWGMWLWYRRYVLPLHRISEDVEAFLHGTAQARPALDEPDPAGLVPLLHAMMDRFQQAESALETRLEDALGALTEEKTRLESLLDALGEGVVACSAEGRVLSYNRAARDLLGEDAPLGVGRPVTELIDPSMLDHAREVLPEQLGKGVGHPSVSFVWKGPANGSPLRARLAPLLVYGGRLEGFVLTLSARTPPPAPPPPVRAPAALANGPDEETAFELAQPLAGLRYVVFDTETTGLNPSAGDEVIQIAAVVIANGRLVEGEAFDRLVDPQRPIGRAARRVHGISDVQVRGQPTLPELLPAFFAFARGAVLVAHHAAFDLQFLRRHAEAAGLRFSQPVLDTMLLSAVVHPNQPSHSLDSLIVRYGLGAEGRHSALGDARITAGLLLRLLPQLARRDILTLGQALEASRRQPLARLR